MIEDEIKHRTITLKHFWAIKLPLILFLIVSVFAGGYYVGTRRMEFAQEVARSNNQLEYPGIAYSRDGITHCYASGNWYKAKVTSTKGAWPTFKAVP